MRQKIDELRLLTKCVLGDDRDAFGKLVERYQSDIRRFFINLSCNFALADDLAQETFIKAYISIRSFKMRSSFKTWLYRIAYNEFYDYLRKQKIETEVDETMASTLPSSATDAKLDVATALKSLNPTERSCIVLFFIEDRPIKDIVKITGLAEGTVKSSISRGNTKLANFLNIE